MYVYVYGPARLCTTSRRLAKLTGPVPELRRDRNGQATGTGSFARPASKALPVASVRRPCIITRHVECIQSPQFTLPILIYFIFFNLSLTMAESTHSHLLGNIFCGWAYHDIDLISFYLIITTMQSNAAPYRHVELTHLKRVVKRFEE